MSLFTLLEAARYLEYKSEASARGEEPHDYTTFTQLSAGGSTIVANKLGNNQNNIGSKNLTGAGTNNMTNGLSHCHGSNSSSASITHTDHHVKLLNGTSGGNTSLTVTTTTGSSHQQNHTPQQLLHLPHQQLSNNSSSSNASSSDSPPLPFTLTTTLGSTPVSLAGAGVVTATANNNNNNNNNAVLSSSLVGYRQRSGSAASRQRTDSLSSHDDSSRDPHNKQSRRSGGAGTREVHNKLEKNRRAHLKECFESLKKQLPNIQDDRKTSNLTILRSALRYIQNLKKKEREFEQQMEQLAREKISAQQRLATLRRDGSCVLPLHDNLNAHHLPHQTSLPHQPNHHNQLKSTTLTLSGTNTATTPSTKITTVSACNSRDSALPGVVTNAQHATGVGSLDIQRRTISAGLGTGDRASEKLATNELKRRGSVSPDNETTTTASECGNLSDYEGDEFELVSHAGASQRQTLQNSTSANHSSSITTTAAATATANNSTLRRDRDNHLTNNHHRLGGTKTAPPAVTAAGSTTSSAATSAVETRTITTVSSVDTATAADVLATSLSAGSSTFRAGNRFAAVSTLQEMANNGGNANSNGNNIKKHDDHNSSTSSTSDVATFNSSLNNNAHIKNRHINSLNKEIKIIESAAIDTKEECKPITISVTSGSVASVIATAPAANPIYQQATAGIHKASRREIKDEPVDKKSIALSNGLGGNVGGMGTSQAIAFVTTSSNAKAHTGDSSNEGGQPIEVSPVATTVTMEPPRAIFTPGNQKTVLPTYLPNTGNLATLLHAANTVSYIKAASAVNNSSGGNSHGELTVTVSSAPMATVSSGSMVASVVPPTMVSSITSSMVPSMGQIPLMCKPGSVVRLAASGHLVQPLTLVQQIPAAATAANGITGGNGSSNGMAGKAVSTASSQATITPSTNHGHATQPGSAHLFLAQTATSTPGGAFKASALAPTATGQPVTSMATVITQATSSQASHHPTQIVAGVAPIGKVQLGGTTATLSIKPVSQFPLISGQQFITTSSQSLKPVVVVSVPQTSTQ